MRAARALWLAARYALALAAVAVFLFPLYWLLVTALKTPAEMLSYPPVWWPQAPHFANFADLIQTGDARAIANSLAVAALSTMVAVGLGTPAAYALSRLRRGGTLCAAWALAVRMAPPVMIVAPFAIVLPTPGWVGSLVLLVLMLSAFNLPFVLWMMLGYFRDIPAALEETALVAGLAREEIFARIAWPMSRDACIATAAFTFVLAWNELAFALVLTDGGAATLPVRLAQDGGEPQAWGHAAALSVVGTLPVVAVLLLIRRRLARTLSFGFVRG